MSVAVITDSAAALSAEFAAAHGITVVPMLLTVDGHSARDGEIPVDALVTATEVETSGPSPGDFGRAIQRRLTPDGVLVMTIASTMSSTHQSASLATSSFEGRVRVVDTQTAAGAQALVVLAAADAAERGATLDEVERIARDVMTRVHLVAMVPSLDYLAKSGRVPGIAEWVGRHLRVVPMFDFTAGAVRNRRPALGVDAAYDRMVQLLAHDRIEGASLHVAAYHSLAPEAATRLLSRVKSIVDPKTEFIGEFGSVMVAHTGPGIVGLAWWWEAG